MKGDTMLLDDIKEQITKIEEGDYSVPNGDAYRELDLQDLRFLVDRLEEALDKARQTLDEL